MSKELLFVVSTHGDEQIGNKAVQGLDHQQSTVGFDVVTANEKAYKLGKRYIDNDLNRSFPGDPNSSQYELQRAAELVKIIKQYKYVIDIHGTGAKSGIFTIVSNPTPNNLRLAGSLPPKNIVIWESSSGVDRTLSGQALCGIEIEAGPKDDPLVLANLADTVQKIVNTGINLTTADLSSKRVFKVVGKILDNKTGSMPVDWQDFVQTEHKSEKFYPLLVGEYGDIWCYKMQAVKSNDLILVD